MKEVILKSKKIQHWEESCNQYLSLLDRNTVFSDGKIPTYAIDKTTCLQSFNAAICLSSFSSLCPLDNLIKKIGKNLAPDALKEELNFKYEIPDICIFDRFYMEIIAMQYKLLNANEHIDLNSLLRESKLSSKKFDEEFPIFTDNRREKVFSGIVFIAPVFDIKQNKLNLQNWINKQLENTNYMMAGFFFAPEPYQWEFNGKCYPGILLVQDADINKPLKSFIKKDFATDDIV